MNPITAFWNHLKRYRETYFFPALASVLLWLSIQLVEFLTEREVIEDVGAIVSTLVCIWRCVIIASFVGAVQESLFGYRSEQQPEGFALRLRDDVFDAVVTFCLLLLVGYAVFRL